MKKRILIFDDVSENIEALFALLKDDYVLTPAKNGESAIKKAHKIQPDLILMDIIMPGMDGYQVCRELKSNPMTQDIPIIFSSAMTEVGDETKGFELGAVDYIAKPFRPPIVKARVRNHLKLRESIVKLQEAMKELKRLYSLALDANPMMKLPGNNSVAARIEKALDDQADVCIIYSDLDNFKAF